MPQSSSLEFLKNNLRKSSQSEDEIVSLGDLVEEEGPQIKMICADSLIALVLPSFLRV